jgi:hypothetical protein
VSLPTQTAAFSNKPPTRLLLAVALISASVLGFEVALTRVFAVLLRYHLAFLAVSIALCGLGLGGYAAHWWRRRGAISLPGIAQAFGIAIVLAMALMLRGIFAYLPQAYWLAMIVVLVPFTLAGVWLAEVFARYPLWSGRIYAWDLAGAALTAIAIVGVLQVLSAIDACLLIGIVAAVSAWLVPSSPIAEPASSADETVPSTAAPGRASGLLVTPLALLLVLVLNITSPRWMPHPGNIKTAQLLDIPAVPPKYDKENQSLADKGYTQPLFTELGDPVQNKEKILDTRWNAFARTDVVYDPIIPDSFYIYTNGNVPTNMMQWDGQSLNSLARVRDYFPLNDWAFGNASLGAGKPAGGSWQAPSPERKGRVLAIGPGGGLDALLALWHGAERFDGAEINPAIVHLMKEPKYVKFNGGIYLRPDVNVVTAEGRSYVREALVHGRHYDLLFSALTKTATAGQSMALLESFIYTTDAFNDYLNLLNDDGQLIIVLDQPTLLARFFTTAVTVLEKRHPGMDTKTACRQIAIIYNGRPGPYVFAIVVQKSPFTIPQTYQLEESARRLKLEPIWIPHQTQESPYRELGTGDMSLAQFEQQTLTRPNNPFDISPCPDDRPYVLDFLPETLPIFKQLTWFSLVLSMLLIVVSWQTGRAGRATAMTADDAEFASRFATRDALMVFYFLTLGIGFMLVEIPMIEKLILPLGYPTLALTVILFAILLGGGIGAWVSQRFAGQPLRWWGVGCAVGVAVVTTGSISVLDQAQSALLAMALIPRCAVTALLLMPLGFLLGSPFPSGLRLFAARHPQHVPLIWGLNGVASVVGSLCAAMGAKNVGFSAMLLVGALTYIGAAVLLWTGSTTEPDDALDRMPTAPDSVPTESE